MGNLRERVASDLSFSLTGSDWGLPIVLVSPDNVSYNVTGQVLYNSKATDPDTGEQFIVNNPVVTLETAALTRIPLDGEKWGVKIPVTPSTTAVKEDFVLASRPPERSSVGFIRLYLTRVYA